MACASLGSEKNVDGFARWQLASGSTPRHRPSWRNTVRVSYTSATGGGKGRRHSLEMTGMRTYNLIVLLAVSLAVCGAARPQDAAEEAAPDPAASPNTPKQPLLDRVAQFLNEDDWKFQRFEDAALLRTAFQGDNGNWNVVVQSKEDFEQVFIYSVWSNNVPKDKRALVSEFLTRANYGMPIGCFEMDFEDGELRYRTSVDVEGGELTPVMIKNLLYLNAYTFDKYLPGLNKVVFGDISPTDAVAEIEKTAEQPAPPEATPESAETPPQDAGK